MVGKYQASNLPGALTRVTLGTSQQLGLSSFPPHQKLAAASRLVLTYSSKGTPIFITLLVTSSEPLETSFSLLRKFSTWTNSYSSFKTHFKAHFSSDASPDQVKG